MTDELLEKWRRDRSAVQVPDGFPTVVMARVRERAKLKGAGLLAARWVEWALAMPVPVAALAGLGLVVGLGRMTVTLVLLLLTTGKGF